MVSIFGTTAGAIQQHDLERCAQLWIAAKVLDGWRHSGRVELERLRSLMVDDYEILSRRRFDQVVAQGDGVFWERGRGRGGQKWLYYRSEARVAFALGVRVVSGFALVVNLDEMLRTRNIRRLRTVFHDLFLSGRGESPISRQSIARATGTSAESQRSYEEERGIERRTVLAIIGRYNAHEMASQRYRDEHDAESRSGGPAFAFVDYHGLCSPANTSKPSERVYIARQLANSYDGTQPTAFERSIRRINTKLRNLYDSSARNRRGNARQSERLYYASEVAWERQQKQLTARYRREQQLGDGRHAQRPRDRVAFVERPAVNQTMFYRESLFFLEKNP